MQPIDGRRNHMARMIKVKLIMELRDQGMARRSIAKTRHMCVSSRGFEQKEHRKLSSLSIGSAHAF